MLFKLLRLFGIDLPARVAEVRVDVEERLDLAKDSIEQAAQKATILALLFFLAGLAALSAIGVGLIALYSWVSGNYGELYGFAVVGSVLLFVTALMFTSAISQTKSWPGESASRVAAKKLEFAQARAKRVAAATKAFEEPPLSPPPQSSGATVAGDLIDPLVWALSSRIKLPAMGNPAMEELVAHLLSSARKAADETVERLAGAVRNGDRRQLLAALGGAIFVGRFLGRHSQRKIDNLES